jgi:riboflavin synthase
VFTGLVEEVGHLARIERRGPGARVTVRCHLGERAPLVLGESIACAGVCLTVDQILADGFVADVSTETLAKTTLGGLAGGALNLERATPAGGRLGGHVVLGHVDDVATVSRLSPSGEGLVAYFTLAGELRGLVATKGSVTIDGVSLTINSVDDSPERVEISVMLVPHTQKNTTLPNLQVGSRVNVEVDVLARYVARQLAVFGVGRERPEPSHEASDSSLLEKLQRGGYM